MFYHQMGLSMHGSYPGCSGHKHVSTRAQGSCPPVERDSEAHSMHGTTGGCDGEGRDLSNLRFIYFGYYFLFHRFTVQLIVLDGTYYVMYIISNSTYLLPNFFTSILLPTTLYSSKQFFYYFPQYKKETPISLERVRTDLGTQLESWASSRQHWLVQPSNNNNNNDQIAIESQSTTNNLNMS